VSAGYSGTPLVRKLGIKPGHRVLVLGAPRGFSLDADERDRALLEDVVVQNRASTVLNDVVIAFCPDAATLDLRFDAAVGRMPRGGAVWVLWPKKSSGRATDLDENGVRARALAAGLVDVKVCAVDEVWSGLKIVRRLHDR
jgi:hypothetical protein